MSQILRIKVIFFPLHLRLLETLQNRDKNKNLSWIYNELISKKLGMLKLSGVWKLGLFLIWDWKSQTAVTDGLTRKMLQDTEFNLGKIHYRKTEKQN